MSIALIKDLNGNVTPQNVKIGSLVLDAVVSIEHTSKMAIPRFPVENGAVVTDNAYKMPSRANISGIISAVKLKTGTISPDEAYQELEAIQEKAEPFTLVTPTKTYENVLLSNLTVPDNQETAGELHFSAEINEVFIPGVSIIPIEKVKPAFKKALQPNVNKGKQPAPLIKPKYKGINNHKYNLNRKALGKEVMNTPRWHSFWNSQRSTGLVGQ